jgi:NAD(P)-dependent dehydrogenase (short-subunit alcohol dehydrogenase family)
VASQIAAVKQLEALGASVHVLAADVTSESAIAVALQTYEQAGYPPIKGVFHSAGTAFPQIMLQMNAADFNKVLRPKVIGAWTLHRYFEDRPLDFFVLFSSIAALVVSPGQGNYALVTHLWMRWLSTRQAKGLPVSVLTGVPGRGGHGHQARPGGIL